jgi:hypothetical protein
MEVKLQGQGYAAVGGTDEAGRGPLAGPVVAAVCVIPADVDVPPGVNDSKAMSEAEREAVYAQLVADPRIKWAVCVTDHQEIDRINILQASLGAMRQAAESLLAACPGALNFLLVDGNRMPQGLPVPAQAVVKGDATCTCIAAASIIAKVRACAWAGWLCSRMQGQVAPWLNGTAVVVCAGNLSAWLQQPGRASYGSTKKCCQHPLPPKRRCLACRR